MDWQQLSTSGGEGAGEWSRRAPAAAAGAEPGAGWVSWDSQGLGGHCEEPRENHLSSLCGDSGRMARPQLWGQCGSASPSGQPAPAWQPGRLSCGGWNSAFLHGNHWGPSAVHCGTACGCQSVWKMPQLCQGCSTRVQGGGLQGRRALPEPRKGDLLDIARPQRK